MNYGRTSVAHDKPEVLATAKPRQRPMGALGIPARKTFGFDTPKTESPT